MATKITTTFTDLEHAQIDLLVVRSQNSNLIHQFNTDDELIRHATLAYIDFWFRMMDGELDGHPSLPTLFNTIDYLNTRLLEFQRP